MIEPPVLDTRQLDPGNPDITVEPDFLGYTPASGLKLVEAQGPVFRTRMNGRETYVICGHEADLAAWRTPDNWRYGPPAPGGDFFLEQMGDVHVTQLDGEPHRRARKLILPAFGVAAVTRDLPVVSTVMQAGLQSWAGRSIDVHPVLSRLLTRALSRSQLIEPLTDHEVEMLVSFEEAFIPASSLSPDERQQWYSRKAFQDARSTAFNVFERVADNRLQGARPGDSLDLVMDRATPDGLAPLSRDELISAVYLLLVAGVGNIANIVCAALWALAEHPGWRAKLQEETAGFDPLSLRQGLSRYPVMKAVISEVERCYLPAPVIPKMSAADMDLLGYHIPADVDVLHLHGLAHFEEARYSHPFEFDPGRWLSGEAERANAFGGGTHLCLGMGVTRLYLPLTLGPLGSGVDWSVEGPPRLVSQVEDAGADVRIPKTTRFPVTFIARN